MSNEPRVWLGCLACYNSGALVGVWLAPEVAAEITTDDLHTRAGALDRLERDRTTGYGDHEELWVMDSEHVPVSGEFSPALCQDIADAWDRVGETQWDAYLAYCRTGLGGVGQVIGGEGVSDPADFEEAYAGEWDSWREYADETADEMIACHVADRRQAPPYGYAGDGSTSEGDDFLSRYFDYAAFARDLAFDYATEPAPGGGVYVFRSF